MPIPAMPNMPEIKPQRTFTLWFMSVCSMIDAISNIITYLCYMLAPQKMAELLPQAASTLGMTPENVDKIQAAFSAITPSQFGMLIGVEVLMFVGVLLMIWKLNQIGFHLYTIGQLLNILVLNFVIGGDMAMDFTSILTVVFLIAIYAMHLRYMRSLDGKADQDATEITDNTNQHE